MSKSIKLTDDVYLDGSSIVQDKMPLPEYFNKTSACGLFETSQDVILNKTALYNGVQIPLDLSIYNYGNVFELRDGKIYCNKSAIVLVSIFVATTLGDGYLLFGGNDGGYNAYVGASSDSRLAGYTYVGSTMYKFNKNSFASLLLGRADPYSNIRIFRTAKMSISVIRYI